MPSRSQIMLVSLIFLLVNSCSSLSTPAPTPLPMSGAAIVETTASAKTAPAGAIEVTAYGAVCDGVANDTAAFAAASEAINQQGGGTLWLPPNATCVVGKQTFVPGEGYHPTPIIHIHDCANQVALMGNGARLLAADGLRFGSFDPNTGTPYTPSEMPFTEPAYRADAYSMVSLVHNQSVTVSDMELDGNIDGLILGGEWGDTGRQAAAEGILAIDNQNLNILNVHTHHHGLDGLMIAYYGLNPDSPATPTLLDGVVSEYNARQGFSWVGGIGLTVRNSQFNHTGQARFWSPPGAGVDIEAEDSVNRNGLFQNCEFTNNVGPGLVADSGDSANITVRDSSFWGLTNYSIWSNKPYMRFESCDFHGTAIRAYGSRMEPESANQFVNSTFDDFPHPLYGRPYIFKALIDIEGGDGHNVTFDGCAFTATQSQSLFVLDQDLDDPVTLLNSTISHQYPDDVAATLAGVFLQNVHFSEAFASPPPTPYRIDAEPVRVGEGVVVDGPHVTFLSLTGLIPPGDYPPSQSSITPAWQPRGMGGGGLVYVSISPHNAQEMYAATDMSAVFHTTDFGQQWQTVPFTQLTGAAETDVRFTADPDVLYAIHWYDSWWGQKMPVRSDDGGQTFHPLPAAPPISPGEPAHRLLVDPDHTERFVVVYDYGIYYSGDGGQTYTFVAAYDDSSPNGIRLSGVFWDGETVLVASNQGLYRSTNNGESFAPYPLSGIPAGMGLLNFAAADNGSQTRLVATVAPQSELAPGMEWASAPEIYATLNGGAWQKLTVPDGWPFFVEMRDGDVNTLFAAGMAVREGGTVPGVWRSFDGGQTWQALFHTENNQNIATGWTGDGASPSWWWDGAVFGFDVDVNDPNRMVITTNWVYATVDGGVTWHSLAVQPEDRNPPDSPVAFDAYQTSGIDPTGAYWVHWVDAETLFAGYTDISSKRSLDGGLHWWNGYGLGLPINTIYQVIAGADGRLYAAASELHDLYYTVQDAELAAHAWEGGIRFSDDHGASWQVLHDFGAPVVWLVLDPNDSETLYASVVDNTLGGIYVTHNLSAGTAVSFTPLPTPTRTQQRPFNLHILQDGTLVTTWSVRVAADGETFTDSSGVFISLDDGQTWQDRSHPNMTRWTMDLVIDPHDPTQNTWYTAVRGHQNWTTQPTVSDTGGLYRTTDRGQTWTWILRNQQAPRVHSVAIHPTNPNLAYVSTAGNGLLYTQNLQDAAPVFQADTTYPFRALARLFFNPFNRDELWTVTLGNGMLIGRTVRAKSFLPMVLRP